MTFKEFTELALRTESAINPLNSNVISLGLDPRLLHSIMGLPGEQKELALAEENNDNINALEELGDMLWFMAIATDVLGLTDRVNELLERNLTLEEVVAMSPVELKPDDCLVDLAKRTMFYGKEFDVRKAKALVIITIFHVIEMIASKQTNYKIIMRANIEKLKKRYPNKFDTNKAINRDLEAERKTLEENIKDIK